MDWQHHGGGEESTTAPTLSQTSSDFLKKQPVWEAVGALLLFHYREHLDVRCGTLDAWQRTKSQYRESSVLKYSHKRQSAGSNLFCPKPATLTLIPRSWWHQPPCVSQRSVQHIHMISPRFLQIQVYVWCSGGISSKCFGGRIPSPLLKIWRYLLNIVTIGKMVNDLGPILAKPRPLKGYFAWQRPFDPSYSLIQEITGSVPRCHIPNLVLTESFFQKFY